MITVPALTCVAMTTVLHGCTPLPVYRVVVVARIFVGGSLGCPVVGVLIIHGLSIPRCPVPVG